MANCVTLSKGRLISCKEGSAGIKAVCFVPFDSTISFSGTAGEITGIPVSITAAYEYQTINDGSNYTETLSSDKQTRSSLFTGALNLLLAKIDTDTRNEVLMLVKGTVWAFVYDYNGNVFLVGKENGTELVGGTIATGGARTDFYGYTLNFTSLENEPLWKLSPAAKAELEGIKVVGT